DVQRRERPGERTGPIADGKTHAATSDVEGQHARRREVRARSTHVIKWYNFLLRPPNLMFFRLARGFTAAVLLASELLAVQPPDRRQTEALAQRASERLRSLRDEADRLATEERTLLNELQRLELDRRIKTEELAQADRAASDAASNLAGLDSR